LPRLAVRKTYKLFIGGAFPRSESGRTYPVQHPVEHRTDVALASRKDLRDAVVAARAAVAKWSGATAYNRGQILYRAAEMLEGRRAEFTALGVPAAEVDAAVDRWVWYAGWSDKLAQVYGGANPVAGPYFNLSAPEPTGVVGIVAPPGAPLLGLVSVVAPVIVTGNTVVVLAAEQQPLPAVTLAEVLATSDLPGGVVNLLTGRVAELAPWLASHADVNGLDLTGVTDPAPGPEPERSRGDAATSAGASAGPEATDLAQLATSLEQSAAGTLKRVTRPPTGPVDWSADPGLARLTAFLETKTVWHPKGI
jgi:acyl-CoA reductase-like NAD-dependent aldehyde dehydrogenase